MRRLVPSATCQSSDLDISRGRDSRTGQCVELPIASLCGNHYVACFEPRLVPLSKVLYHTCFICGQRCKWWSRQPKLTSSVISDMKPIIYIYRFCCWTLTWLLRHWAWLRRGYWRYRNLIDCLKWSFGSIDRPSHITNTHCVSYIIKFVNYTAIKLSTSTADYLHLV